ncbi:YtxH domain-containing protein [Alkalibacterium sp. 20]|uniref:YtxH domain-containing protein n=1 Tax=Alkalibacterium sp. 20 TaxID=1798803 RepID=UPI0009003522|nr:YtxH domain-containing protein [Alkalibacterium sp. 20]OJF95765.1 hypothetical protein AX762_06025 [Alkalibacterium sp. 20]
MKHFLLGSLSGLVAGGIYGLIKTPRSGEENQQALKNYVDETSDHLQDVSNKVNELKISINQLTTEISFVQNDFMDEMQLIAKEFQHEAEPRLRRIQEKSGKIQTEVEDTATTINA